MTYAFITAIIFAIVAIAGRPWLLAVLWRSDDVQR